MESSNHRCNLAVELKESGRVNCAQAVACAYADLAGLDPALLERLTAAYGAGMGTTEGTCGALVGAGTILGLTSPDRAVAMRRMKQLMHNFRTRNGSTVCADLKGIHTGLPLRSCTDCVADAATLLQELL